MKKILFLLLLWSAGITAQTANGTETKANAFRSLSPQTVTNPVNLSTMGADGTIGKVQSVMNQNANTGLLLGGVISVNADPTKWNLAFGEGYVADPLNGTVAKVAWGTQSALTTPYLTTSTATYVLIANAGSGIGSVLMQNTPPTQQQYRTHVYLGKLAHTTKTTILFAVTEPSRMFDVVGQVMDLNATLKSINSEGNILSANGTNLNLNISSGKIYRAGANYASDRNNPSLTTLSSGTAITFRNKFRDGSGGWTAVNTSTVDADHYDDGTGILAVVPNNKFTVRIAWRFGGTGTVHLDYGQAVYDNLKDAKESISTAIVDKDPDNVKDAAIVGYIVVKKGTAALNNTTENAFYKASMFGEAILTAGGTTDLNGAYNNSVSPQITTTTTGGAVAIKRGSATDTDNVLTVQNGAGTNTFSVNGNGFATTTGLSVNGSQNITSDLYVSGQFVLGGRATTSQLIYTRSINVGGTDLNNLTDAGFYEGFSFSNAPVSGFIWIEVQRYSADNSWVHQRVTTFGSGNTANRIFSRVKNNGVWGLWYEISKTEVMEILSPSNIYATVGTEINLYYDALILAADKGLQSPIGYTVEVYCSKGKMNERSWSYTPISGDIGTENLTIRVFDNRSILIQEKTINLVTINNTSPSSVKNILMIGDSITEEGTITTTVRDNFVALGSNTPIFWGLKGTGANKNEGRGGWSFGSFVSEGPQWVKFIVSGVTSVAYFDLYSHNGNEYRIMEVNITAGSGYIKAEKIGSNSTLSSGTLTKVSGSGDATISFSSFTTEQGNPFWNSGSLDIANYRSNLGMGSSKFDVVTIQLGVNGAGVSPQSDVAIQSIVNDAKTLCNAFLADNSSTKIIIMIPTSCGNTKGGWAAGYGSAGLKEFFRYNIFKLSKKIIETFDNGLYNTNISIGIAGLSIDRYYGYGLYNRIVGSRYSETEETHNNAVHPRLEGYEQLGDAIYPQIKNNL